MTQKCGFARAGGPCQEYIASGVFYQSVGYSEIFVVCVMDHKRRADCAAKVIK